MNRTPEAGARNILWACREEGQGCHGEYIQDCKVEEPRGLVVGEDGKLLQERVFKELMVVLEEVEEGISGNI